MWWWCLLLYRYHSTRGIVIAFAFTPAFLLLSMGGHLDDTIQLPSWMVSSQILFEFLRRFSSSHDFIIVRFYRRVVKIFAIFAMLSHNPRRLHRRCVCLVSFRFVSILIMLRSTVHSQTQCVYRYLCGCWPCSPRMPYMLTTLQLS